MILKLIQSKMVLKLSQSGPKMMPNGPKWSPPPIPIPIPGVSKSLLPGGKKIENTCFLMIFYVQQWSPFCASHPFSRVIAAHKSQPNGYQMQWPGFELRTFEPAAAKDPKEPNLTSSALATER